MNRTRPTPRGRSVMFIATNLSTGGGVNKVIRDLAVLLSRRLGAKVTVVNARSDQPSAYPFPSDLPVEMHRPQTLLSYFALLLKLRRSRPDFVISSWTHDNILVALAFVFSRSRVILAEHTSWNHQGPAVRLVRRIIYPLASHVIVLNPAELQHYSRFLKNVRLIPNPVDPPASPALLKREKLIIAVGHLEPRKNFAEAIRAMAISRLEKQGWSLAIIGAGEEAADLTAMIKQVGLRQTSIHSPTADLPEWYARASLTLVTARLEVFSLVLAEAMLCGVIPVAYATDGPSFILEDFPDHLVPAGETGQLADRLIHFAKMDDREALREKLRSSIELRFSDDAVAEAWKDLLSPAGQLERKK